MKKAYLLSQPSPFAIILQPSTKTQPQVNLGNKRTRQDRVLFIIIKLLTKNKNKKKKKRKITNPSSFIILFKKAMYLNQLESSQNISASIVSLYISIHANVQRCMCACKYSNKDFQTLRKKALMFNRLCSFFLRKLD